MKKPILAVLVVLGIAVGAGAGYWFGQQRAPAATAAAPAAPAAGPAAVTVEAVKVVTASMPQTITAVGSLRSDESITVRPEVAGRISAILFNEGQRVAKGATLVKLDPSINVADVEQARANLKLAKSKFDRAVDLAKSNFISGQAKDEAENNLRVAEAALQLAEAKLAKTEIRAPFSGVIGLRVVSVGDYVKEGADVVNLEAIDPLKVDFRVPEIYLKQVQVGQPLDVSLDALPGKTYEGKVYAINPLVDATGRSIVIRAQVKNADTSLRPGMFARVRLITREAQDALVIPEQAIVPQGEEQYVFRIVDGKALRTKVAVGQRRDGKVEILGGLSGGDTVVSAGQLKLRDGVPVAVTGNGDRAVAGGPSKDAPRPEPAKAPPGSAPKS
ncbi:MAG TPA: efflux RND transporter periplasmic adaptor subunit [Casimicrobiaceae bacterium]|nr:efflux RND transporter periplasmic adaptor subunit [Casimicrobiaceae bacterium]